MIHNFIDTVGESNPQLFRELKGRLQPINLILASGSSLLLQLIVFWYEIQNDHWEKIFLSLSVIFVFNPSC